MIPENRPLGMVAALAMMELMTSEQITNAGSVTADHDSIQTHAQTRSRQNSLATGGPSERKCDLRWRPAMLHSASLRALLPWLTSIIGIVSALCLVIAWFPSTVWNTPIASSDAPAHYYFIRRLLDEGLGAALHLWPHNSFYPPLFHICAYFVIKIAALFGVQCSIYAAFNITWIIASGVIFPSGMLVLCRYFLQRWNRGNPISNPISRISQASPTSESSSVSESSNVSNQHASSAVNQQYNATFDATFVLQNLLGLFVPVLAVSSVCHPYGLLNAGPLIAFGFATSLLPFLIAATLRLFDEISAREHIVKWLAITAIAGVICLVAHPRIAFTYALILVPFIVLRLPWKLILGAFIAMCVGAVAFVALMLTSFKSDRWANPASWFHSHQPSKNLWESISFCFADGLDGFPAILFALLLIAGTVAAFVCASRRTVVRFSDSLSVAVSTVAPAFSADADALASDTAVPAPAVSPVPTSGLPAVSCSDAADVSLFESSEPSRPRRNDRLRDVIALMAAFLLVTLVYVCTVTLVGALPNIISAPWYRDENRIVTMLPLVALPLLVIGVNAFSECVSACAASASFAPSVSSFSAKNNASSSSFVPSLSSGPAVSSVKSVSFASNWTGPIAAFLAIAILAVSAQIVCPSRTAVRDAIIAHSSLDQSDPNEQLTEQKIIVLRKVTERTGTQATIISDPLNGSMYAETLFNANMLYPIINARTDVSSAPFGKVETAFASGDVQQVLGTVCPLTDAPKYFLTMGDQAQSLQSFPYRAQYDSFHNEELIDAYVDDGTLVKVADYSQYGQGWALYRFGCAD
ncbi:hypothetical protein PL701_07895 [Bifidobacterium catenulatum]|uniref:DUF6541 family protein n=1 Tax=Bifidobacterium catenulatum TaxID=1686 RepID=UPI00232BC2EA|nr:DUF6541 family protein [Bifidobacterium catenulatum]MDB1141030.1 hypothetical protein [Bifidobacterium catenulatum]